MLNLPEPGQPCFRQPLSYFIACINLLKVEESLEVWMILSFQWKTITFVEHILQAVYFHTPFSILIRYSVSILSSYCYFWSSFWMENLIFFVIQYSESLISCLCLTSKEWEEESTSWQHGQTPWALQFTKGSQVCSPLSAANEIFLHMWTETITETNSALISDWQNNSILNTLNS